MIVILGTALMVGMVAVCVGTFYNCKKSKQYHDGNETIETESPTVHIKISHPQRSQFCNDAPSLNAFDTTRDSIDSNGTTMKQTAQKLGPVSSEELQIPHTNQLRNRRRTTSSVWSPAFRNQLENITNSSSEMCGSTRVVKAHVEVNPIISEPNSQETFDSFRRRSLRRNLDNFPGSVPKQSHQMIRKTRKMSSVVQRWRNLKKALLGSRSDKLVNDYDISEMQKLNVPVTVTGHRSPMGQPTTIQRNRLVDASTSTKISANALEIKGRNDGIVKSYDASENNQSTSKQSDNEQVYSNTETLQEMMSLVQRQSVNGKSVCDIRITGLSVNQSELLDLVEATNNKTQSASIITTEEASIISIKFDRRKSSNERVNNEQNFFYSGAFKSFPRKFEELSFFKLFRSQERSERPDRTAQPAQISDHSRTSAGSRNETSYIDFPTVRNRLVANESVLVGRKSSLRRRFADNYASRLHEDRQI